MHRSLIQLTMAAGVALALSACNRNQTVPESQTSSGVQPTAQTMSVKGCLRSGLAENTFVLTEQAGPAQETATYQLIGKDDDLRKHVGEQVEVFGTVRAEEHVASSAADVESKRAKGTSGTPTIETTTELNVKHMTVSSVTASGQRCVE
jgi:hypothetical protein